MNYRYIIILSLFLSLNTFAKTLIECKLDDSHEYKVIKTSEIELHYFKNGNLEEITIMDPSSEYGEYPFTRYNRMEAQLFRMTNTDPSLITATREVRLFGSAKTFIINYFNKDGKAIAGGLFANQARPMDCF